MLSEIEVNENVIIFFLLIIKLHGAHMFEGEVKDNEKLRI